MAAVVERQVGQQVGQQAAMGGAETAEADEQPAVADPHRTRKHKESQREKESRRRKKKAALSTRQAEGVVEGDQRRHQAALEASETNARAGQGGSRLLRGTLEDTLLEPTTAEASEDTLLEPTAAAAEYVNLVFHTAYVFLPIHIGSIGQP